MRRQECPTVEVTAENQSQQKSRQFTAASLNPYATLSSAPLRKSRYSDSNAVTASSSTRPAIDYSVITLTLEVILRYRSAVQPTAVKSAHKHATIPEVFKAVYTLPRSAS